MNLDVIYHELKLNEKIGELICADGQNPRHRPLIDKRDAELFIHSGEFGPELMARYQGIGYEIGLCDACYENIIINLMQAKGTKLLPAPDSPNFESQELKDFRDRGYQRENRHNHKVQPQKDQP